MPSWVTWAQMALGAATAVNFLLETLPLWGRKNTAWRRTLEQHSDCLSPESRLRTLAVEVCDAARARVAQQPNLFVEAIQDTYNPRDLFKWLEGMLTSTFGLVSLVVMLIVFYQGVSVWLWHMLRPPPPPPLGVHCAPPPRKSDGLAERLDAAVRRRNTSTHVELLE